MMYCPDCRALSENGETCPSCGSKKLRGAQPEDSVFLFTSSSEDCGSVTGAFEDAGIPFELRTNTAEGSPEALFGKTPGVEKSVFVPYGALERCRAILESMGMLDETGRLRKNMDGKTDGSARSLWRAFSVVLFAFLVWAAVTFADRIAEAVKLWFSTRT